MAAVTRAIRGALRSHHRPIAAIMPRSCTTIPSSTAAAPVVAARALSSTTPPPTSRASSSSSSVVPSFDFESRMKPGLLSAEQLQQFVRDGYLYLPKFSSIADMNSLKEATRRIVDQFDPNEHRSVFSTGPDRQTTDDYFLGSGDTTRCFFEPEAFHGDGTLKSDKHLSINKIGHAMHDLDDAFRKFTYSDSMRALHRSLGYTAPAMVQSMYIFKQPRIGGPVDAHQDSTFLYTTPQSVTGFWWAVEDATLSNGCLWAIPGSHRLGNKSRFIRNPAQVTDKKAPSTIFDPPTKVLSVDGAVPLEVPAGGLVILHGDLVHFSKDNRSGISRHAFTLHSIETAFNVTYPAENWLQRSDGKPFTRLY